MDEDSEHSSSDEDYGMPKEVETYSKESSRLSLFKITSSRFKFKDIVQQIIDECYLDCILLLWMLGILELKVRNLLWGIKLIALASFFTSIGAATTDILK